MKNKILSIVLAFALILALMPTHTIAMYRSVGELLTEGETPGEGETPDEGEGGEDEDTEDTALLENDVMYHTHPTHLSEGSVSLSECFNKSVNPGLMSFTKGEVATTGSVSVTDWSVGSDAVVHFRVSGATAGDTITFPVTVNAQYFGSIPLTVIVTIGYDDLTIICNTTITYGEKLTLSCEGLKGNGAVIYTIVDGEHRASISDNVLTALKTGTVTIRAIQVPDQASGVYAPRESKIVTITIEKATPTVTASSASLEHAGMTLSDAQLKIKSASVDGQIEWVLPDNTIVLANTAYEWIFTPTDYENYEPVKGTLTPYVVRDGDFVIGSGTTTKNDDGSYTTVAYGEDDSRYELTEYPDGRLRMVHRQLDGTIVTTVKEPDGSRTITTENKDGSVRVESYLSGGVTYCTTKDRYGRVNIQISLPQSMTDAAAKSGSTIELPIDDLPNTDNRADAPTIVFSISSKNPVRVSIPINNPSAGTVAIFVSKNGEETIVKTSITGRDCLLVTLNGSTTVKVVDAAKRFKDVSRKDWFYSSAAFVTSRGLFQGMDHITFAPTGTMSRAMIVQVLHNLEDNPRSGILPFYTDIEGMWYAEPACWASYRGYINGFPDGTFRGDEQITREQLAVIIYRYVGMPSIYGFVNTPIFDYYDYGDISTYAWSAMYWAINSGILYTSGANHLAPQQPPTRAEVAQTFRNLVEYLNR